MVILLITNLPSFQFYHRFGKNVYLKIVLIRKEVQSLHISYTKEGKL